MLMFEWEALQMGALHRPLQFDQHLEETGQVHLQVLAVDFPNALSNERLGTD